MRILRVRLRNVKSFGETSSDVEFADGVNFLSGVNGAGKSTLIESIGYALFDVLTYNRDDFLRRGAKTGVVTVWVEDVGERFRVERKFGSTNSWVVYDDGDVALHDKASDVVRFMCERFHVADDRQLQNVFQNIIGVPQGMFTALFKMRPAERKAIFDGIINVHLYRKSADDHGLVKNQMVVNEIHALEKRIEGARSYVEDHHEDPKKLAEADARLMIVANQIRELATGKSALQKAKKALDETKRKLDSLDMKLASLGASISESEKSLNQAEEEVQRSKGAKTACARALPGHRAFLEAEGRIVLLEKSRTERDGLTRKVHELDKVIKADEALIEGLESSLKRLRETERRRVEEINEFEEAWEAKGAEAKAADKEAEGAKKSVDRLRATFEEGGRAEKEFLKRLDTARAAAGQIQEYLELIARIEKVLTTYDEVSKLANAADETRKAENSLRSQLTRKQTEIDEQESHKRELASQVCPFIKEACDRVKPAVFQAKIADLKVEARLIEERLEGSKKAAGAAAQAEKRLEGLREKKSQLSEAKSGLRREWSKARRLLTEWKPIWGKSPEFASNDDGVLDISAFERYARDWASEITRQDLQLKAEAEAEKRAAARAEGKQSKADAAKKNLEDARDRLNDVKGEISEDEGQLIKRRETLERSRQKRSGVLAELKSFVSLDEDLTKVRALVQTHAAAHKEYVQNERAAAELEKRQHQVGQVEAALLRDRNQQQETQSDRKKIADTYDPERAAKVATEFEETVAHLASSETERQNQEQQKAELARNVERLRQQQASIVRWSAEKGRLERFRALLDDVWSILRALGPRVSGRLLAGISSRANRIFGLLHDQPARLDWGKDYELRLKQGESEYPFGNLSGGEQMSAALAIQMAMARDFAGSSFCIFDEPTIHLDEGRRERLASAIREAQVDAGFAQVFIVSHDDTFGPYVDLQVKLRKDPAVGTVTLS